MYILSRQAQYPGDLYIGIHVQRIDQYFGFGGIIFPDLGDILLERYGKIDGIF